ncbi:potassium channel family protein [Brachybacterium alimentarium]|uniref:potassium channel family protein n=1 Tax=Brachybacterium alimentarium TaxID=47845 RepID=UPI002163999E|nr:potassium channel protein [Brachybacterium alimentarium]
MVHRRFASVPDLVERIAMELSEAVRRRAERAPGPRRRSRAGLLIAAVGALMVVVYAAAFLGVMRLEGHDFSWISAVYWTITTMSTLGYGDVTFESDLGRLLSIIVLLSGVVYMLVLLPFFVIQYVVTPWLDRRRMARTPRKVPALLRDHVLLVGSDAVTQAFAARAERSRVPAVLVVEDPVEAGLLHDQGRQVVVGPLDSAQTYRNAGADRARLVASTLSDTANTNVAFTVRQVSGDVPVAVTASKPVSTDVLSLAGSDHVLELGAVLGREMAGRVLGTTGRVHRIGSFGETIIAEAAARGTALVGLTLEQAIGELRCCVRILALLRKGRLRPMKPESTITDSTVLILAGEAPELAAYDEQFQVHEQSEDPVIILGGGRVGRSASRELTAQGLPNTIVEQLPGRVENSYSALEGTASYRVIDGDAADQRILRRAGLESASAVLVTPRDDDLNVYLTLFCRRLRPELQVVSRATYERNVATLYRAGADGVLSYATIGATDLWNHAGLSHRVLVAEGNELFLVPRPSSLVRRSVRDAEVHRRTGCHIVAVGDEDGTLSYDTESIPSAPGKLLLLGDRHAERLFRQTYLKHRRFRSGDRAGAAR